ASPVNASATKSGAGGPLVTDLTVSVSRNGKLTKIYDGADTCKKEGWGASSAGPRVGAGIRGACNSSSGGYVLDLVPVNANGKISHGGGGEGPEEAVITLLEGTRAGDLVPVDSARIKLPADSRANNADPPVIDAPDLNAVAPVPSKSTGRSLSGRVRQLAP